MKTHLVVSQRDYMEALRGGNGGMRLVRKAEDITVGEINRWTQAPLERVACFIPKALVLIRKQARAYCRDIAIFCAEFSGLYGLFCPFSTI